MNGSTHSHVCRRVNKAHVPSTSQSSTGAGISLPWLYGLVRTLLREVATIRRSSGLGARTVSMRSKCDPERTTLVWKSASTVA
jgi:hypothetical protein